MDPFKSWYLETRSDPEMENRLACGKHFSHKDSTKIWNGLYCITWNTILRIPDPESKTISWEGGVGREVRHFEQAIAGQKATIQLKQKHF